MFATINTAVQTKKKPSDNITDRADAIQELKEKKSKDEEKTEDNSESIDFEFGNTAILKEELETEKETVEKDDENVDKDLKDEDQVENDESSEESEQTEELPIDKVPSEKKEVAKGARQIEMAKPELDGGEERVIAEHDTKIQSNAENISTLAEKAQTESEKAIQVLGKNEKQKEDAGTKRKKADEAVVESTEDKQSEANASLVDEMADQKADPVKKAEALSTVNSTLLNLMPKTLEDVDNFKENKVANKVSSKVGKEIDAKAGGINSTFGKMDTPSKAAAPKTATPLGDIEKAKETNKLTLGTELVKPASEESLDLSTYKEESDNLLEKEGISKEQLEMVDSGDLAEAKKEMEGIDEKVDAEPKAIRDEEKRQSDTANKELNKKEQDAKKGMRASREAGLKESLSKQGDTKTGLEKKKKEVTETINKKYEKANADVQSKLSNLKEKALQDFDKAAASASNTFESNVKARMEAFKRKRYVGDGGVWDRTKGAALFAKDYLMGIDDFPEVQAILSSERATYIGSIDTAISTITNESQTTIDDCKSIIALAKKEIKTYVDGLGPGLKEIGDQAQKEVAKKLDALDKKVNAAAKELKKALADKRKSAIEAIDKRIEEMKEEMSGALSKLGSFLLDAMLKFFKWALEKVGVSMEDIMPVVNKGISVVTALVTSPLQFLKNLGSAVGGGVNNFIDNFLTHLKNGFFEWLTGSVGEAGITIPEQWDFKGIIFFIGEVLGLGWNTVKDKLGLVIGKERVEQAENLIAKGEQGLEIAKQVKEGGLAGAIELGKDQLESAKETAVEEVSTWVWTSIAKAAGIKILSMLNPAGAILQIIKTIYDVIMWFINNFSRIIQFITSIFDSISNIAAGAIGPAMKSIEAALSKTVPIIISFLARLVGLDGVGKAVMGIIKKIRAKVDKVITKVVNWIGKKLKVIFDKVKGFFGGKDKNVKGKKKDSKYNPEKQKRIEVGFTFLHKEEDRLDKDKNDKITLGQAQDVADRTKKKHEIFSSIRAVDSNGKIKYKYTASPENEIESEKSIETESHPILNYKKPILKNNNSEFIKGESKKEIEKMGYNFYKVDEQFMIRRIKKDSLPQVHIDENGNIVLGGKSGKSEHTKFKPNIISWKLISGGIKIEYNYLAEEFEGRTFSTIVEFGEEASSTNKRIISEGKELQLKEKGSRGSTDSSGSILGAEFKKSIGKNAVHSAHLIADWFTGSGYKGSGNIIPASKKYNTVEMKSVEENIANNKKVVGKVFDLKVVANMKIYPDDKVEKALKNEELLPDVEGPDNFTADQISKIMNKLNKELDPQYATDTAYYLNNKLLGALSADELLKKWIESKK